MATLSQFAPPPPWSNQDLRLYHGTLNVHSQAIKRHVDVTKGRLDSDFGRGFYTTTIRRQARAWSWQLAQDYNANRIARSWAVPVVIEFRVKREELSRLRCLVFVRGSHDFDDYWSLVHHCRERGTGHIPSQAAGPAHWYDLVAGPVTALWRTRLAIANSDQFSFHTNVGEDLLDRASKRVIPVKV
jgi:uncharacterized protein DUF3990